MTPSTGWYPVALSADIPAATSAGTRLFGQEIVVWRDTHGAARVWEDRCPHRGMRLSFGFVRSDRIACLYHGWQFGSEGRCLHIPAHPDLDVPATIQVQRRAVRERQGFIWTFEGEGETDATDIEAGETLPIRSLYIDRAASEVEAVLMSRLPPPFEAGAYGSWRKDGVCLTLEILVGGAHAILTAGLQPLAADESAVHFTLAGDPQLCRRATQIHFARWAESLRRDLEADAPKPASI